MNGKVVIITGGSSGIGRSCALLLGSHGARIVFTGQNPEHIRETSKALTEAGVDHLALQLDNSLDENNRELVSKTLKTFGRIDILINNAGISMRALFEDLELETFRKVFETNFYSTVSLTKYALPHLLESRGVLVGITSINGRRSTPGRIAYNASKYAQEGFFETLRMEVMNKGLHVLVVSPGFTASNIRNAALNEKRIAQHGSPRNERRMMQPEEVAEAVLHGIRKKKRDMVLTRQGKMLVFLNKFIPGQLDRIVYNYMAREPDSPLR